MAEHKWEETYPEVKLRKKFASPHDLVGRLIGMEFAEHDAEDSYLCVGKVMNYVSQYRKHQVWYVDGDWDVSDLTKKDEPWRLADQDSLARLVDPPWEEVDDEDIKRLIKAGADTCKGPSDAKKKAKRKLQNLADSIIEKKDKTRVESQADKNRVESQAAKPCAPRFSNISQSVLNLVETDDDDDDDEDSGSIARQSPSPQRLGSIPIQPRSSQPVTGEVKQAPHKADSATSTRDSDHSTADPIQLDHDAHSMGAQEQVEERAAMAEALNVQAELAISHRSASAEAHPAAQAPSKGSLPVKNVATRQAQRGRAASAEAQPAAQAPSKGSQPHSRPSKRQVERAASEQPHKRARVEEVVPTGLGANGSPTVKKKRSNVISSDHDDTCSHAQVAADAHAGSLGAGGAFPNGEVAEEPTAATAVTSEVPAGERDEELPSRVVHQRSLPLSTAPEEDGIANGASAAGVPSSDAPTAGGGLENHDAPGTSVQASVGPLGVLPSAIPPAYTGSIEEEPDAQEQSHTVPTVRDQTHESAGITEEGVTVNTRQPEGLSAGQAQQPHVSVAEGSSALAIYDSGPQQSSGGALSSAAAPTELLMAVIESNIDEQCQAVAQRAATVMAEEIAGFKASMIATVREALSSAFSHSALTSQTLALPSAAVGQSAVTERTQQQGIQPQHVASDIGAHRSSADRSRQQAGLSQASKGAKWAEPSRAAMEESVRSERSRKRRQVDMPMPMGAAAVMKRLRAEHKELAIKLQNLPQLTAGAREVMAQQAVQRDTAAIAQRAQRSAQLQADKSKAGELDARISALKADPRVQEKLTAVAKRRQQKREMQDRLDMWRSQLSHAERLQVEMALQEQRAAAEQASVQARTTAETPAAAQDQAAAQHRGPEYEPSQPTKLFQRSTRLARRKAAKAAQRCNRPKSVNKNVKEPLMRTGGSVEAGYASGSGSLMDYASGSGSFASFAEQDITVDEDFNGRWCDGPVPALLTHPGAVEAHQQVVWGHKMRTKKAQECLGLSWVEGRTLGGYAARCGASNLVNGAVAFGCGTALADVHYVCHDCCREGSGGAGAAGEDDNEDPETMDYCTECMAASGWLCPNPDCHSRTLRWPDPRQRLEPLDYLNSSLGRRKFACASEELLRKGAHGAAYAIAESERRQLKGALTGLPAECRSLNFAEEPMYDANAEIFMRHCLGQNGLDEGVCVLVHGVADFFDNTPFAPAAMLQLAREDAGKLEGNPVLIMSQFSEHGGASKPAEQASVDAFFAPMLKAGNYVGDLPPDVSEDDSHCGYKAPDVGIQPKLQSQVFVDGLKKLGLGDYATPEGIHNLARCLCDEDRDKENGTQVPDLGPKFYIARPLLVKPRGYDPVRYDGMTFTPLHCDLADAVNYSCSGERAEWIIFRRNDRRRLMDFLRDQYGDGRIGEDILWNKTNHRLLDEDDLRILAMHYGVRPWRFWQKEGVMVVIPAGCAHQVTNGPNCYNIKVAQDFLAPQSAKVILELLAEMKTAKIEDKLQAVLTLRFAGADAMAARKVDGE